ncbi:MAG: hypothetical protein AAF664_08575 [Planctomycetota bacterium]
MKHCFLRSRFQEQINGMAIVLLGGVKFTRTTVFDSAAAGAFGGRSGSLGKSVGSQSLGLATPASAVAAYLDSMGPSYVGKSFFASIDATT